MVHLHGLEEVVVHVEVHLHGEVRGQLVQLVQLDRGHLKVGERLVQLRQQLVQQLHSAWPLLGIHVGDGETVLQLSGGEVGLPVDGQGGDVLAALPNSQQLLWTHIPSRGRLSCRCSTGEGTWTQMFQFLCRSSWRKNVSFSETVELAPISAANFQSVCCSVASTGTTDQSSNSHAFSTAPKLPAMSGTQTGSCGLLPHTAAHLAQYRVKFSR